MEQDFIREEVKKLKKDKKINYAYFSRKLQISINSFYNFMCGSRNLSQEKLSSSNLTRLKSSMLR